MMYYDDLPVGERVVPGPITLSAAEVIAFARRYDPQPFHLSDAGARDTYFGRLAASGWQTFTVILDLLQNGRDEPLACLGAVGFEDLRWRRPVYPDDRLWADIKATARRDGPPAAGYGDVDFAIEVRNQDEIVVMSIARITLRLRCRA